MDILITDITNMHAGNFCVAGWDIDNGKMVRPLPDGGNWASQLITRHNIQLGHIYRFTMSGMQVNGAYPHRTEDCPVYSDRVLSLNAMHIDWLSGIMPGAATSVRDAFDGNIQMGAPWNGRSKAYVTANTQTRSLYGVVIRSSQIRFVTENQKLRAYINDQSGSYDLAVTGSDLVNKGIALNRNLRQTDRVHLRLGLARAWPGQPERCYAMLNGMFW